LSDLIEVVYIVPSCQRGFIELCAMKRIDIQIVQQFKNTIIIIVISAPLGMATTVFAMELIKFNSENNGHETKEYHHEKTEEAINLTYGPTAPTNKI